MRHPGRKRKESIISRLRLWWQRAFTNNDHIPLVHTPTTARRSYILVVLLGTAQARARGINYSEGTRDHTEGTTFLLRVNLTQAYSRAFRLRRQENYIDFDVRTYCRPRLFVGVFVSITRHALPKGQKRDIDHLLVFTAFHNVRHTTIDRMVTFSGDDIAPVSVGYPAETVFCPLDGSAKTSTASNCDIRQKGLSLPRETIK